MDERAREPGRFCAELAPRLIGSLTLYCGDRMLAEELAQEALARALERWDRVGAMAAPEAWTYRTAFNLARSTFRRAGAERRARARAPRAEQPPDPTDVIAIRDAVRALPERQREVVIARFYIGLDVAETARLLGCRAGTVKAHTFKAMANLRAAGLTDGDDADEAAGADEEERVDDTLA